MRWASVMEHLAHDQPGENRLMAMIIPDLAGQRFGRLVALRRGDDYIEPSGSRRVRWECACDCGGNALVEQRRLLNGGTKSCKCLRRDRPATLPRSHGMVDTPEYRAWYSVKRRCQNPKCKGWSRYGGRGIRVCDRWRDSFRAFLADVGPKPGPEYSLDRIDVNGHYEPGNVRWATPVEQSQNRRNNVYVTFQGRRELVVNVARALGIPYHTLRSRLRMGWEEHRWGDPHAPQSKCPKIAYQGDSTTIAELARRLGIKPATLRYRIKRGWPEHRWGEPARPRRPS